jgi:hypothetical protein
MTAQMIRATSETVLLAVEVSTIGMTIATAMITRTIQPVAVMHFDGRGRCTTDAQRDTD